MERPLGDLQVQNISINNLVRRREKKSSFHLISKYECLTDVQKYFWNAEVFKVWFKKHIMQDSSESYKVQPFLTLQCKIGLVVLKNYRPAVDFVKMETMLF